MVKKLKQLAFRLIICLLVIVVISQSLSSLLPFSWGSPQLNSKLAYIEENDLDPNIYFIGSSITNRQLMPSIFDTIVGSAYSTFNLAVDGTMPPHHFYLLENLIERDTSIDFIFMELDLVYLKANTTLCR